MNGEPEVLEGKRFFSLRWKAIILLSLVLILVNSILGTWAYWQSSGRFELDRAFVKQQQNRIITELFSQAFKDMSAFSGMIPLLESAQPNLSFDQRIKRVLENNGAMLALEWGIETVHLFSKEGVQQIAWPDASTSLPESLGIEKVFELEIEQSALVCEPECRFYLAVPLLAKGHFSGVLVLSRSTADVFVELNKLTGGYVAVLQSYFAHGARARDGLSLPLWRENVPVVTDPDNAFPLLEAISVELNRDDVLERSHLVLFEDKWLEVYQADYVFDGSRLLVVNEVTSVKDFIENTFKNSVLMGLSGLLISALLLFVILQAPMRRLSRLAANMPLLAENEFISFHRGMKSSKPELRRSEDEIDIVEASVKEVALRLSVAKKAREAAQNNLGWLIEHDPLTRLANRAGFNKEFEKLHKMALRYHHTGALLIFDIDQFKEVNDISGHPVGDAMLREVSKSLDPLVRDTDLLARVGGDAFAMVLPQADEAQAKALADRIHEQLSGVEIIGHDCRHKVLVSLGIVMYPDENQSSHDLIVSAELAMFQAKNKGGNAWHMFSADEQVKERMNAHVLWKEQIDQALREDGFVMHFQPIVEVSTGKILRSEVLLRMKDSEGEVISPDEFIPIAEQTGQIAHIDYWVLEKAIEKLAQNPEIRLAVNLSGSAMADAELPDKIRVLLAKYQANPYHLLLEVTETVALIDLETVARSMREIKGQGCQFAIDDFGTGYATYGYLRNLPVDVIKIDGSFIQNLNNNDQDKLFVEAIVYIARGLGKKVVAEYVHNQEILMILEAIGVDYAQGYYVGKPSAELLGTRLYSD